MEATPASSAEQLLVGNLELVERLIRHLCRNRLDPAEVEEFSAWVKLRLVDNDYAILRKFQRRCSLPTYLNVVIKRLLSDYQIHLRGKWHTSAAAQKLGPIAVTLERLLHRDRKSLDEAAAILQATEKDAPSRAELEKLAAKLPSRRAHPSFVNAEDMTEELAVSPEPIEDGAMARDRRTTEKTIAVTLKEGLAELSSEDLTILRLLFAQAMTVADVARMMHVEQKPLYRRIETIYKNLKKRLASAGIGAADAEEIVGRHDTSLEVGLLLMGNPATRSSPMKGTGTGEVRGSE
ncbi:MAG: sigma-70 family RNA polymerase sigma factor [Acidobacteria bacterium]|nr:sigma-70 family RNA polymerase sigma factor [Acidobacteriota bacterium]